MSKFLNISTDNTLGGNSAADDVVSSQKAIKDYIDGHASTWGSITGTLSNQTDLQNALDAKQDEIVQQSSAPLNPSAGDLWIDTDESVAPTIIPTPTSADANKILSVNSNGQYVLITVVNSENIAY